MPSRRSHTKSHHGCVQCKTRRVKCDETLPECLRCVRRQMRCSFREQTHPSFIQNGSRRESTSQRDVAVSAHETIVNMATPISTNDFHSSISSASTSQSRSFGMVEIELIHHYSTQTYMSITSRLTSHIVWRDVMFREAMRYDFLLDALMATSALHKSVMLPEGSEARAEFARRALGFQNAALSGYIPALNNPTQANAIGLFAISALLPVWSFGSKKLPEGFGKTDTGLSPTLTTKSDRAIHNGAEDVLDFDSVIALLQIMQGINQVVMQTKPWLQRDLSELIRFPADEDLPPIEPDVRAAFDLLSTTINNTCAKDETQTGSTRDKQTIYLERLQSLHKVARCRTVLEYDMNIFAWPVTVNPIFIDLLRQRDPIALVLFIHWAVCFRSLDHLWWARGWSYRLVKDFSAYLDSSWSACLEWPRRSLGLEYQRTLGDG